MTTHKDTRSATSVTGALPAGDPPPRDVDLLLGELRRIGDTLGALVAELEVNTAAVGIVAMEVDRIQGAVELIAGRVGAAEATLDSIREWSSVQEELSYAVEIADLGRWAARTGEDVL